MNSSPFCGPLAFKAVMDTTSGQAVMDTTSGQTQNISLGLSTSWSFGKKSIVWPMNLCCGPRMPMSQTPPYLDLQEFLHLVFQATHTLAPEDLIPIPLANQQGAKEKKVRHLSSKALVLESQHLVEHHHTLQLRYR